jgi:hypothetical protein
MKEAISGILAIIAIGAAIVWAGYEEHNHTLENCEVVKVYQDKTVVEDQAGNLWEFISNDYTPGVHVDLKMHTNFTHGTFTDDIVTDVE